MGADPIPPDHRHPHGTASASGFPTSAPGATTKAGISTSAGFTDIAGFVTLARVCRSVRLGRQHRTTDEAAHQVGVNRTLKRLPDWYAKYSPHHHLPKNTTPILVTHGNKDYRVPVSESLRLWWDLVSGYDGKSQNMPHRFLQFTTENHWGRAPPGSGTRRSLASAISMFGIESLCRASFSTGDGRGRSGRRCFDQSDQISLAVPDERLPLVGPGRSECGIFVMEDHLRLRLGGDAGRSQPPADRPSVRSVSRWLLLSDMPTPSDRVHGVAAVTEGAQSAC